MKSKAAALACFFVCLCLFGSQTAVGVEKILLQVRQMEDLPLVVIDAGHGGEDGGAVGVSGSLEKDINLQIARKLADYLQTEGFRVQMTREEDQSLGDASLGTVAQRKRSDTQRRLALVEEAGACLFVSIHQNYFTQPQYDGAQLFYSPNDPESALLAEAIRQSVVGELQPENRRQNKEDDGSIYLLRKCQVPAVLVECGFLSNAAEEQKLLQEDYQARMAAAIGRGILAYCRNGTQDGASTNGSKKQDDLSV